MGWVEKQKEVREGVRVVRKGWERYKRVVEKREGFSWYEAEVHPAVVSAVLGKRVWGRSYELSTEEYKEWLDKTGMDMVYGYVPWKYGRCETVDEWGRTVYTGPNAEVGDLLWPPNYDALRHRLDEICKLKGGRGVEWALYNTPMVAMDALGLEKMSYALHDKPTETYSWFRKIDDRVQKELEIILEWPVEVVVCVQVFCDKNGLLMNPEMTEKYGLDFLRMRSHFIKEEGRMVALHCDGSNEKLYAEFIANGVQIFNGYEGKCQIEDVRKWGKRLAFRGCVDLWTLEKGTPEDIKKVVVEKKRTLGSHIIGSCHDVGDISPANFLAMKDAALVDDA